MANPEHLKIIKSGGSTWNKWRTEHRLAQPNLEGADLTGVQLNNAYLRDANLRGVSLRRASLQNANLNYAKLDRASFDFADLEDTAMSMANLTNATFFSSRLVKTNLMHSDLQGANFAGAVVSKTRFAHAHVGRTIFAAIDLSDVDGLEDLEHSGPSIIDVETFNKSRGKIPERFLRGCGLSDWQIETVKLYQPDLSNEQINDILYTVHGLRASQAIQINPLFISYSHKDDSFVNQLERHLNSKGIRFWRDIHHATAGRLETQVDRAIRLNPTVLLILSSSAVQSDWVEHEVKLARRLARELGRDVLCPISLDDSWKTCHWPERLLEQIMEYHVLDFSSWNDASTFHRMFLRLIEGLDLFYKKL